MGEQLSPIYAKIMQSKKKFSRLGTSGRVIMLSSHRQDKAK